MAIGAILGIAQAGIGIMGAFGDGGAAAENRYRKTVYKQQIKEWQRKNLESVARYNNKKAMFQEQVALNDEGATRANSAQQRQLNQAFGQNKLREQGAAIQQAQALGRVNAREVSGNSQNRLRGSTLAAFGRNQAIRQQNLMNATQETDIGMRNINRQLNLANREAYSQVRCAPTFSSAPVAPMMTQGPSALSKIAGIGSSLMTGIGTASELTAPGQGINKLLGIK